MPTRPNRNQLMLTHVDNAGLDTQTTRNGKRGERRAARRRPIEERDVGEKAREQHAH